MANIVAFDQVIFGKLLHFIHVEFIVQDLFDKIINSTNRFLIIMKMFKF